jgi:glycine cleavage system transcriptional repressor
LIPVIRMTQAPPSTVLITLVTPDCTGLVAAVAGALFDLGASLGDTTFAVLGEAAEWSAITEIPADVSAAEVESALKTLPQTQQARITVEPFGYGATTGPTAQITHRLVLSGGDRPGLIARLAEVFEQYGVNIVRLNATRLPAGSGAQYMVRVAASIPPDVADRCLATVVNTAGELSLSCAWDKV